MEFLCTERFVNFGDAVLAIAITLLAIDLPVPSGATSLPVGSRAFALWALAPRLGRILRHFHAQDRLLGDIDGGSGGKHDA